ncbi:phosphoribosylglycinamide synthetase [Kitasatospora sp. MMS16-BH015]|uniref:ATP-grasp domain-containing protein n=1 Tax=Kitasatospora sp. MMS16-BH015 TaxID=2018025 RepID=UPI000CA1C584|nr:ATP-grasp domain-containing protein [Kitasatospora sp. MMS16-BH015]AUG78708.1 phosphoribosylglycinamide synthetase [Kitasatospora sp. MMS16-BH015]
MKSVLVLSWIAIGNVPAAVREIRARGLRPVLVSNLPADPNAGLCEDHVVFDWDGEELPALLARIEERGITPIAVVSMVEKLIEWSIALTTHYDLPGGGPARQVLVSKYAVREHLRATGRSAIRFTGDPLAVDFFPAILKPARESSASYLVKRVDDREELLAHLADLERAGKGGVELIAEEFLDGVEFSVDGPVLGGRFHPLLAVEKPDHDDLRHHDAGLELHPPQREFVRAGVRELSEVVSGLCADRGLDQVWLHFEGRSTAAGRTELIEINLRAGGGQIPHVLGELYGIDVYAVIVAMALGEYTPEQVPAPRERPMLGWFDVEAKEVGTVEVATTEAELLALPGVLDVNLAHGYRVTRLDQENFFLSFTMAADSVDQLREHAARVLDTLEYAVRP